MNEKIEKFFPSPRLMLLRGFKKLCEVGLKADQGLGFESRRQRVRKLVMGFYMPGFICRNSD